MRNEKGQASFESVFIAGVIILIAMVIAGQFNAIKNSTIALGLVKTNTLSALNASPKEFVIKKIGIASEDPASGTINFLIDTEPDLSDCSDANTSGTEQLIAYHGLYEIGKIGIKLDTRTDFC